MNIPDRCLAKIIRGDALSRTPRAERLKTLVLCHGVFDIVHPGHIRHLLYAKSKGDVLVVSITADRYVDKAKYRPFVPQDMRALNLAILECVDYVVINDEKTPINLIRELQPEFFAKGYEYQVNRSSLTEAEAQAVSEYGGQMLFTPGDVVYSSTALLNSGSPDLKLDKLFMLMRRQNITFDDLQKALDFHGISVHVVGDTIIDRVTHTSLIGASGKTPTLSVRADSRQAFLGGAAIVALHMAAAGADVVFTTVTGDDLMRDLAMQKLGAAHVVVKAFVDQTRPTTIKDVFECDGARLLKVDTVDNRSIANGILTDFCGQIVNNKTNAVVFSDFRHGIFNEHTIPKLVDAIPHGAVRVADSQLASRWGNICEFRKFNLITPNEREARFALGDQDTGVMPLLDKLYDATGCLDIIVKLGEHGVVSRSAEPNGAAFYTLDSFANHVVDPVGAGDALLAYATLVFTATENLCLATILGNVAAALECEVDGNEPVSVEAVRERVEEIRRCEL